MLWVHFIGTLTCGLLLREASGFGAGAPAYKCQDMMPSHRGLPAQSQQSPFAVEVSKTSFTPGETLIVTLRAARGSFYRGFLVEARTRTSVIVGTFTPTEISKTLDCHNHHDGITHVNYQDKFTVSFPWTAPLDRVGDIVFVATVVQVYDQFWVGIQSSLISPGVATPRAVSSTTTTTSSTVKTAPTTHRMTDRPISTVHTNTETDALPATSLVADSACGVSKGCFVDCHGADCNYIVSWVDVGPAFDITLAAKLQGSGPKWIAVGFSSDTKMGSDSVTECIGHGSDIKIRHSYNENTNNVPVKNPLTGIASSATSSFVDGVFRCRFNRTKTIEVDDKIFDLSKKWHIMFAHGMAKLVTKRGSSGGLVYAKLPHSFTQGQLPRASPHSIDFQSISVIGKGAGYPLVKAHGCIMTLAWVFCTGVGIIVARFYKTVWPNNLLMGQKVWFQVHRTCMVSAFILTIIGFIAIFVEAGGYSQIPAVPGHEYLQAHPILGIIVTLLVIINPVMSLFRCSPEDKHRKIFNWAHWGVGMVAHLLSVITICFGVQLSKASTPEQAVHVMIVYVVYHVIMDVVLEVVDFNIRRKGEEKLPHIQLLSLICWIRNKLFVSNARKTDVIDNHEMKPPEYESTEANGHTGTVDKADHKDSFLKKILLGVHIVITMVFTLVVFLFIALN